MVMKYIAVEKSESEKIILFSKSLVHKDMAKRINMKVVSAGFVDISNNPKCFGRSESLNMESRPAADERLIQNEIFLQ